MLITGEFIDAQSALQQGLINRVAPAEQLEDVLQSLINAITSKSAVALKTGKDMFYKQLDMDLAERKERAKELAQTATLQADDFVLYKEVSEEIQQLELQKKRWMEQKLKAER